MWIRFLNRVRITDGVSVNDGQVTLEAPELEGLEIRWFKNESGTWLEQTAQRGKRQWQPSPRDSGSYKVTVQFHTPEVRRPTDRFNDERTFEIHE